MDLALTLALGGDACSDLVTVRAEPGVFGPAGSGPTLSRTIGRLAGDVDKVLAAINTARTTARASVWAAAGTNAPDHTRNAAHSLVIDIDAALVTAHSEKELAAPSACPDRSTPGAWATASPASSSPPRDGPGSRGPSATAPNAGRRSTASMRPGSSG